MIHIYPEMKSSRIITPEFIAVIRQQFKLDWSGIHGAPHWVRVRDNGLRLAEQTDSRSDVIELFAFLHDTQRENDYRDPKHGRRAADFAKRLQGSLFTLDDEGLDLLCFACIGHSDGVLEADITVQTCWDSDRLDLGRGGVIPDPSKLCTAAARNPKMIEWASRNHVAHHKDITRK